MGCLFSFLTMGYCSKVDEARILSKKIDRDILKELKNEPDEIELLLLGASESGKSTILKQMRIIHKSDYSLEEKLMFRPIIFANTIQSMSIILHAVERLGISLDSEESEYNAYMFYQLLEERTSHSHTLVEDLKLTPDLGKIIALLWADGGVQTAFEKGHVYHLSDCAEYFLSNVKRLTNVGYVPTTQDILHTRVKTCGIVEVKFIIKDMLFRLHDVGGQKSERRKWLSLFDCVHAVAFCVSLTSYECTVSVQGGGTAGFGSLPSGGGGGGKRQKGNSSNKGQNEDQQQQQQQQQYQQQTSATTEATSNTGGANQMCESLSLFGKIVNNKVFSDAAMILFLTKTDLFHVRIRLTPITVAFPDYTGEQDYEESTKFITNQFKDTKKKGPKVYTHLTCTTDTNNMRFTLNAVTDMLIKNYLKDCGIY